MAVVGAECDYRRGRGVRFWPAHPRHVSALAGPAHGSGLGRGAVAHRCLGHVCGLFARRAAPSGQSAHATLGAETADPAHPTETTRPANDLLLKKTVFP